MYCNSRLFVLISVLVFTVSANDLELTFETKNLKEKGEIHTGTMYVSGTRVTMKVFNAKAEGYMIFRGDKNLIWAVDDTKKEYMEITRETLAKIGGAVNDAMAELEAQMANMPPEQREMMKGMMEQQMGEIMKAAKQEMEFVNTGETKKINGYTCTRYVAKHDKEISRELWVTKWGSFKNSQEIMTAFKAMSDFSKSLLESLQNTPLANAFDTPYSYSEKIGGFPVLVVEYDEGKPVLETLFKSAAKKKLAAGIFEPPDGYTVNKPDMPERK